ncbi:unnamed protein product [Lymnaea stagnalis]|uniref:Large ribosomal subunit protein mL46 n=1 Tax=Lymnaea stagnalis TaxID=6523 RepID=A0AAV2I6E2_LYMST
MALRQWQIITSLCSFLRRNKNKEIILCVSSIRHFSSSNSCHHLRQLYSAVCVERHPIIGAEKNKLEQRFADLMAQLELEKSFLSDHEVRLIKEKQAALTENENKEETNKETETALDLEDKWEAELKLFTPAPRETEADYKNDRHSLERKLDKSLYLLVKQNIEGKDHWILPQTTWRNGETMRQTAERALSSICGDVKVTFLGNAPCAFAKFDPDKIFFFKAWYREGQVIPNKDFAKDYLWVTRTELSEYCFGGYHKQIKKFIPPL